MKNIEKMLNVFPKDYYETKVKETVENEILEVEINLDQNVFGYNLMSKLKENGFYFISIFKASENTIKLQIGVKNHTS